ncbi:hypothetical protein PRIPAC_85521, partial [Pristionchus pacificus]
SDRLNKKQMVKDRLAEIRFEDGNDFLKNFRGCEKDKLLKRKDEKKPSDQFCEEIYHINDEIAKLEDEIEDIRVLHGKLLSLAADPALTKELNKKTADFRKKLKRLTKELKTFSKGVESGKLSSANGTSRTDRQQVNSLLLSFSSLIEKFNEDRRNYNDKNTKKLKGYLRVLDATLSEDAFEDALTNGTLTIQMNRGILGLAEKQALSEVKQRSADIQAVEKSIHDLDEMIQDLHMLTLSQGEILDNISKHVELSADYVERAKETIKEAKKLKRKARKMKIMIVIGTIVLVVVLITIVAAIF